MRSNGSSGVVHRNNILILCLYSAGSSSRYFCFPPSNLPTFATFTASYYFVHSTMASSSESGSSNEGNSATFSVSVLEGVARPPPPLHTVELQLAEIHSKRGCEASVAAGPGLLERAPRSRREGTLVVISRKEFLRTGPLQLL